MARNYTESGTRPAGDGRCTAVVGLLAMGALLVWPHPAWGDALEWNPARSAVVMIAGDLEGTPTFGAGLVVGADAGVLYIVTANHVVRSGEEEAGDLRVRFGSRPAEEVAAEILDHRDRALDLAVLAVRGDAARLHATGIFFDILGDPRGLRRGDGVFAMGAPEGRRWWVSIDPEKVESVAGTRILFQARLLRPGHSGGALFDACQRLVGMLVADVPPHGEALSIDVLLERMRAWGVPVALALSRGAGCEKDRRKLVFAVGAALAMLGQSSRGTGEPVFEVALERLGLPELQRRDLASRYLSLNQSVRAGRLSGSALVRGREVLLTDVSSRLDVLFGPQDAGYVRLGQNLCLLVILLRSWESLERNGGDLGFEAGSLLWVLQNGLDRFELPAETAAGIRELRAADLSQPAGRTRALERLEAAVDHFDLEPL